MEKIRVNKIKKKDFTRLLPDFLHRLCESDKGKGGSQVSLLFLVTLATSNLHLLVVFQNNRGTIEALATYEWVIKGDFVNINNSEAYPNALLTCINPLARDNMDFYDDEVGFNWLCYILFWPFKVV